MRRCLTTLVFLWAGVLCAVAPIRSTFAAPEAGAMSAPASGPRSQAAPCQSCHADPTLALTLPSGESLSLFVDEAAMFGSVHSGKLTCTDCHSRITDVPHKRVQATSRREYAVAQYEACKRCHFSNYTKTLDGIHYEALETGDQDAPLCTDCHGYHNVTRPDEPRSRISASCAQCHREVYDSYVKSVHGAALMQDDNKDVPVCTDCHGTHTIRDASTASFRLNSPEMCASCHADEPLMRKYGISSNVFKTYVHDFHGTTVALTKQQGLDNWTDKAVCSDCHGVHNIQSAKGANAAELKRNVAITCQKCHPGASTNFPDAWLSHYDLTMEKAPLPYLVRAGYTILIPLMVGGLMLHIVVDLWRMARNR